MIALVIASLPMQGLGASAPRPIAVALDTASSHDRSDVAMVGRASLPIDQDDDVSGLARAGLPAQSEAAPSAAAVFAGRPPSIGLFSASPLRRPPRATA